MGYLMKEALKALCGVNQWSYAVLWKIGYQNPRLLIWEECFYEPTPCSRLSGIQGNEGPENAFPDFNSSWDSTRTCNFQSTAAQAGDKVHLLIKKMMADNHVNIVGEGLVGRVAFTGNHQWILSENYVVGAHPPEVLKEVCQQFSAGMKTVAVIPVLPLGVIQFGSYLTITENSGFVNDVTALILQLGEVPGMLLSDSYASKEPVPRIGVPVFLGNSTNDLSLESNMINVASSLIPDGFYHAKSSAQTSALDNRTSYSFAREIRNNLQNTTNAAKFSPAVNVGFSSASQLINSVVKAEVIPSNSMMWSVLDLPPRSSASSNLGAIRCIQQSDRISSDGILRSAGRTNSSLISNSNEFSATLPSVEASELYKVAPQNMSNAKNAVSENITSNCWASDGIKDVYLPKMEASSANSVGVLTSNSSHRCRSDSRHHHTGKKFAQNEFYACTDEIEHYTSRARDVPLFQHYEHLTMASHIPILVEDDTKYLDPYVQPDSGDDLFDVLGADFKNTLFDSCWSGLSNKSSANMHESEKNLASAEVFTNSQGNSADHLLDAIVSNVHSTVKKNMDDSISCRTTLTNTSSSSVPDVSVSHKNFGVSDQMKGELFGFPKYLAKPGATGSCSLRTVYSNEETGTCSQNSTIYGSQLSSWVEKGPNTKLNSSVSTGCSKKPDETNKSNRKRLKPGENPRPRPKDRQMIQDRVKELREIVPNGAKCSIDALLERTIKHMLFLQSVTKHANKLKQTGNSKIISNDGGLLLKDKFEGGATWAYEVGSHSMVCPIIVEDLNQPRQMLVEMLCEERGLFLEIADIIRGLGLSILKGVMETRTDKIWARFVVEANRDVTRMEIFISLVRLLEQSSKSCVPQANNVSYDKMAVQQFHQSSSPPSLPVTGASHNFQ